MKLGIDFDGVVFDSEKLYRTYSEIYDIEILKRNSIIDNKQIRFQKRYNWSEKEITDFSDKYYDVIVNNCNIMEGAREVLNKLKQLDIKIYVITARGYKSSQELTMERLKKEKLDIFDKYYFKQKDKLEMCKYEQVDFMIDDNPDICEYLANNGIKVIYFKDSPSRKLNHKNIKTIYNFGELYRYIIDFLN